MEPIDAILEQDIPEAQQSLRDSNVNLEKVAQYCKANYVQAENKKQAFEDTKNYATQALASVAYQINVFSYNLSQLFEAQDTMVAEMAAEVNHVDQTIKVHKEKIARRDIGALATTNKPNQRQSKVLPPPTPERAIRYSRRNIDYNIYDDIGHGLKMSNINQPRNVRKSGSAMDSASISSGSQNQTYDTKAIYRKTGTVVPNLSGTLSRKQTGNMGDYRTPQIAPVQPPVAPPVATANGHYGPGLGGNQKQLYNSPHLNQRNEHYHPGSLSNYSTGSASPPIYQPQNQQYSPVPSAQYAAQKQAFAYPPSSSSQMSRKSSSASAGYGPLPLNNLNLNGNHSAHQPAHIMHAMSNSGNPPAPPPPGDNYGRRPSSDSSASRYIQNPVPVTVSTQPPPPPPPPPTVVSTTDVVKRNGNATKELPVSPKGAVPNVYLEKVVAIYDYQADKDDELSFMENQIIYVIKKNDDGWYEGVMDGLRGLFPGNYVEPCG